MTSNASSIRPSLLKALSAMFQGQLARRFAVLAGGTAAAQALTLLAAPLLTRLYSPEDYGLLAVFVALFAIASKFVSLNYEQALPVTEDDATAVNLFVLTALIAFVQCCGVGVLALFVAPWIFDAWLPTAVKGYLWLLPPSLFFGAIYASATYWMIREQGFSLIARTKLEQSFAKVFLELILGLLAVRPLGLLLGHVVANVGGAGLILRRLWTMKRYMLVHVTISRMWQAARKYGNFPLYVMPSTVLTAVSGAVPLVLLPVLFGQAHAGYFLVAQRLTTWPMTLVGQSVAQVFYGEIASHRHDRARNLRLFYKLTWRLLLLGVVSAVVLLSAPVWAAVVLGGRWEEAGWVMAALSPLLATRLLASPLSHAHHLQSSQRLFLVIEAARLVLAAGALTFCHLRSVPFLATMVVYSFSISLVYVLHWVALLCILRQLHGPSHGLGPGETPGEPS